MHPTLIPKFWRGEGKTSCSSRGSHHHYNSSIPDDGMSGTVNNCSADCQWHRQGLQCSVWNCQGLQCWLCQCGTVKGCSAHCVSGTVKDCSAHCQCGTVKDGTAHCVSVAPSRTALCQCGTVKDCSVHCVTVKDCSAHCQWQPCARTTLNICNTCTES
jgi:hypothetical protein